LIFGLLVALIFPDEDSLIGVLGTDANVVTETLRQAVSFLQVPFDGLSFPNASGPGVELRGRAAPLLFLAVPIGACAVAAALVSPRLRGSAPRSRLAAYGGLAFAFAVLMLIAALACGDADPSAAGTFFLALLWGGLGALVGVGVSLRREGTPFPLPRERVEVPPALRPLGRVVVATLRPLGVLLAITAVLGTLAWVAYALIDEDTEEHRARDTVEVALYGVDHAVHFAELGAFVSFEPSPEELEQPALPAPTSDADEVDPDDGHRIFAYRDAVPAYLFVPGVIVLIALPLLLALYGGFVAAGAAGAAGASISPGVAAAWGAVVGPVWAIVMTILDTLATKSIEFEALGRSEEVAIFGSADGGGVFLFFLLIGGVLGALGGMLAGSGGSSAAAAGPPAHG